ncbi:MAG: hypothetical protein E6G44_11750 [Actinobacteria bacterium]|nr:MAG: hypothetical protein E6G44_11750 [Actinomycetota bacterium]
MAEQTEGSIEIAGSPADVMEVITDFGAYPEWASGIKSAEVKKTDSKGRPAEVAFEVSQMGIAATYTLAYKYRAGDGGLAWTTKAASGAVKDITQGDLPDVDPARHPHGRVHEAPGRADDHQHRAGGPQETGREPLTSRMRPPTREGMPRPVPLP